MGKLYDRVQEAVKVFENKTANLSESEKALLGTLVVLDAVTGIYQDECREASDAERAALKADILQLFDDLFTKVNVPYVPAAFKGLLEGVLAKPLSQGLDVLHTEFAGIRAEIDTVLKG